MNSIEAFSTILLVSAIAFKAETPLQSLPDYTLGEIGRIAATEQVVHLTDLICRRSTIALLGLATPAVLGELAEILGGFLSWDRARSDEELRQALRETAPFKSCPTQSPLGSARTG